MIGGRKNIVFYKVLSCISLMLSFITDHFLLEDYNLNVYQKKDLEANVAFWKSLKLETL